MTSPMASPQGCQRIVEFEEGNIEFKKSQRTSLLHPRNLHLLEELASSSSKNRTFQMQVSVGLKKRSG